ncbi:MAG: molybdopterin-dependent oxidoreductase [Rhodospirillales bacterium]|nr:molybdopterin-dependent oxidoreductase [Rhodospirillales bacterium]
MFWKIWSLLVMALVVVGGPAGAGQALPEPAERVILVIEGDMTHTNTSPAGARFDMAMLKNIKSHTINTITPWTEGMQAYEGPLLRDVLKAVGAVGSTVKAVAINDYAVDIPVSDLEKYSVILAHTLNGKAMSVRDKGPLWVIYPWSDNAALRKETFYAKSIWQVKKLTIQ